MKYRCAYCGEEFTKEELDRCGDIRCPSCHNILDWEAYPEEIEESDLINDNGE